MSFQHIGTAALLVALAALPAQAQRQNALSSGLLANPTVTFTVQNQIPVSEAIKIHLRGQSDGWKTVASSEGMRLQGLVRNKEAVAVRVVDSQGNVQPGASIQNYLRQEINNSDQPQPGGPNTICFKFRVCKFVARYRQFGTRWMRVWEKKCWDEQVCVLIPH